MNKIMEFFGKPVASCDTETVKSVIKQQLCPFTQTRCFKIRKSQPDISIGTCTVQYGKEGKSIIICPKRLLCNHQVFCDCIHLLTLHEPGNEFHIIPEVSVPGGSIDFFLASVRNGKVKDFVAIEFQTLDTTGTVWPERQRLLATHNMQVDLQDVEAEKNFGMNWKMTAKTTLVQLHHKIETLEHLGKHLVLVLQDHLLDYMKKEFCFEHLTNPGKIGDSMHFHAYTFDKDEDKFSLLLSVRQSTDAAGMASCLRLAVESKIELQTILPELEQKVSSKSRMIIS